jgi:hypothetical protein
MRSGLKGRTYHEEIIALGRDPRRRALKAWWRARERDIPKRSADDYVPASEERICYTILRPSTKEAASFRHCK